MTIADRTQGFSIQVAADLYGKKENLCIQLGDRSPPLGDLVAIIEAVYEAEAYSLKPDGVAPPRFQIQYMQSFDEVSGWEDITTAQQIHDGMQLFVFQPRNDVHSDSQDLIPVAKQPVLPFPYLSIVETPSAATPSALGSPLAGNSIINEKAILDTFKRLDKYAAGTVGMNVVRNGFAAMGVDLTASTIASLFGLSAPKGPVDNREVDLDDWFAFATTHPKIIRSLNQYPAEIIKERQREKHRAKLTGDNHSSDAQRRVRQHIQERRATANNLQRAHKETNARSQAAAAERLARGKSCVVREVEGGGGGGGGGDDSHVKSRRGIETQKPVAWKPAGLKRTTSPSATTTRNQPQQDSTVRSSSRPALHESRHSRSRTPVIRKERSRSVGAGGYTAVPPKGAETRRQSVSRQAVATANAAAAASVVSRQPSPESVRHPAPLSAIGQLRQQVYGETAPAASVSAAHFPPQLVRENKSHSPARGERQANFSHRSPSPERSPNAVARLPTTAAYSAVEEEIMRQCHDAAAAAAVLPMHAPPSRAGTFNDIPHDPVPSVGLQRRSMSPPASVIDPQAQIRSPGGSCIPAPVMPPHAQAPTEDGSRWGQWQAPPPPTLAVEDTGFRVAGGSAVSRSASVLRQPTAAVVQHPSYTPHYRPHLAHLQQQQAPTVPTPTHAPVPTPAPRPASAYLSPVSPSPAASIPPSLPSSSPARKWYPNLVSPSL